MSNETVTFSKHLKEQVILTEILFLVKLFFLLLDKYTMPLGMEDRRILSGHLRASSSYNYNHGPDRARLNIYAGHGRTGAWVAKYRSANQWLQIDLRQMSIIKGIATQGRREAHQWVKSFTLSYSVKGLRFRPYVAYGRIKVSRPYWIQGLFWKILNNAVFLSSNSGSLVPYWVWPKGFNHVLS